MTGSNYLGIELLLECWRCPQLLRSMTTISNSEHGRTKTRSAMLPGFLSYHNPLIMLVVQADILS